eukprot:5883775-Karenia_brevis.AAC.1
MSCRQLHGENMSGDDSATKNVVSTNRHGWHKCDLCEVLKPETEFLHGAWRNKARLTNRTLCKDCCNP